MDSPRIQPTADVADSAVLGTGTAAILTNDMYPRSVDKPARKNRLMAYQTGSANDLYKGEIRRGRTVPPG